MLRLVARRYDFIEVVRERRQLWRHGVVLSRKGARALIRTNPQANELTITVLGPNKLRRQFASLIRTEIRDLHAEIPCPEPVEESLIRGEWVKQIHPPKSEVESPLAENPENPPT